MFVRVAVRMQVTVHRAVVMDVPVAVREVGADQEILIGEDLGRRAFGHEAAVRQATFWDWMNST